MPWCLQGDARRVTDSAAHLIEQHWRDGFAFALQELRFAAEELKWKTGGWNDLSVRRRQRLTQDEGGSAIHLQFR